MEKQGGFNMPDIKEKDDKYTIKEDGQVGFIQIADDVVSSIAGLAVTEVEGVSKLTGNVPNELVAKLGKKNLARGIKIDMTEKDIKVDVSIEVKFGYNIMKVSKAVQDKVKQALLNMTGLNVSTVNVKVSGIALGE
jgi:uncharacterized alkaline shock family protein YloU